MPANKTLPRANVIGVYEPEAIFILKNAEPQIAANSNKIEKSKKDAFLIHSP